jgi:aspartate aminotransferase
VLLSVALPVMPYAGAAQGYKITPRQLETSITHKTKLVLMNSPCNPTGAAYTRAELRALGEVLLDHPRILIGTDDMYEKIFWDREPFCSLLTAVPELYNRTITINGVSKGYAMTGWRIGYCGGPREVINAMSTIQGQSTSNASSISQKAATVALNGDQGCVARMNEAFKKRHDFIVQGLNSLPGVSCLPGSGTFYAFADISKAMVNMGCRDDGEFAELLLAQGGVAVVPGAGFGAPGHMRLSFACSMQMLEQAVDRMRRVLTGSKPAGQPPLAATG